MPVARMPDFAVMLIDVSRRMTTSTASLPRPAPLNVGRASVSASKTRTAVRRMRSNNSWKRRRRLVCSMLASRNFIAAQGTFLYRLR